MERDLRRARTARILAQRFALHRQFARHTESLPGTCNYCDLSVRFLDSIRPCSCNCTKRRHGRPGVASGMCCIGDRKRVYVLRAQSRELNQLVVEGWDWDDDVLALLSSTVVLRIH